MARCGWVDLLVLLDPYPYPYPYPYPNLLVLLDEPFELVVEARELLLVGGELRRLALPW